MSALKIILLTFLFIFAEAAGALTKVAIVGGGLAGMTAMYRLQLTGDDEIEVTLFESSGRLGGRSMSLPNKFGPGSVDAGPMFVDSVGQEELTGLMEELGWDLKRELVPAWSEEYPTETYQFHFSHAKTDVEVDELFFTDPHYIKALRVLEKHSRLWGEQTPEGTAFRNQYLPITAEEYLRMLPKAAGVEPEQIEWLVANLAARWSSWGRRGLGDFTCLEVFSFMKVDWKEKNLDLTGGHDENFLIRGGTQRFSDALAAKLNPENIRLNHQVLSVGAALANRYPLVIRGADGRVEAETFDKVILAIPVPLLSEILQTNADIPKTLFEEFGNINYAQIAKIFLHYKNKPWFLNHHSGIAYLGDHNLWPIDNGALPQGDNVMISFLGGLSAEKYSNYTGAQKNEYVAALVEKLEKLWPGGEFIGYQDVYWHSAYWVSSTAKGYPLKNHLRPPIGGIHFTGDYFAGYNGGYMAGAVESANRAAKLILDSAR